MVMEKYRNSPIYSRRIVFHLKESEGYIYEVTHKSICEVYFVYNTISGVYPQLIADINELAEMLKNVRNLN